MPTSPQRRVLRTSFGTAHFGGAAGLSVEEARAESRRWWPLLAGTTWWQQASNILSARVGVGRPRARDRRDRGVPGCRRGWRSARARRRSRGSARRRYGRMRCGAGTSWASRSLSARPAESEARLSFAGLTDLLGRRRRRGSRDAARAAGGGTRRRASPRRREPRARTPARRNSAPVRASRAHVARPGAGCGRRRAMARPAVGRGARVRAAASRRPARRLVVVSLRGRAPPGLRRRSNRRAPPRTRAALGRRAPADRQRAARRHVLAADARAARRRHRAATRSSRSRSRACSPAATCSRRPGRCRCPTIFARSWRTGSRRFRRHARHAPASRSACTSRQRRRRRPSARACRGSGPGLDRRGRQITFTHPLFASAVYGSASARARADVHRALADVVDDPEQRARHLALASTAPDDDAARALEAAAQAARARGRTRCGCRACRAGAAADARQGARRSTSGDSSSRSHLYLAGDFQRAAEVLEELVEHASRRRHSRPRDAVLGRDRVLARGESAAVRLAERALRDAADPLLRARCLASIAMHAATSDLPRAAEAARASLEILGAHGRMQTRRSSRLALSARVRADLFLGDGLDRAAAERALELELEAAAPPVGRRHARPLQARPVAPLRRRLRRRSRLPRACGACGARRGRRVVARQHPAQPHAARVLVGELERRRRAGRQNARAVPADGHQCRARATSGARTSTRTTAASTRCVPPRCRRPAYGEPIVAHAVGARARSRRARGRRRAAAATPPSGRGGRGTRRDGVSRAGGVATRRRRGRGCSRRRRPRARRKRWSRSSRRAPHARRFHGALP